MLYNYKDKDDSNNSHNNDDDNSAAQSNLNTVINLMNMNIFGF